MESDTDVEGKFDVRVVISVQPYSSNPVLWIEFVFYLAWERLVEAAYCKDILQR